MGRVHSYYLGLGSNIRPEYNLGEALRRLRERGVVSEVSGVWESQSVGAEGPDFLNLCVLFEAEADEAELKRSVVDAIEAELGRVRTADKNAPRTIDIDIIMVDNEPVRLERWNHPFVVVPMAELLPDQLHPLTHRPLAAEAESVKASTWIRRRPDVLAEDVGTNGG
jgi:2-amino-4-hydroxy-6-hydroxymethyldihydropteridine diphosphokinase